MNWEFIKEINNNFTTQIYVHKKHKTPDGYSVRLSYDDCEVFSTVETRLSNGVKSYDIFIEQETKLSVRNGRTYQILDIKCWCENFEIPLDKENIKEIMLTIADKIVGLFYNKPHN